MKGASQDNLEKLEKELKKLQKVEINTILKSGLDV